MRRLAMATILLTAVAVGAQAGGLPKPVRLVERMKMYDQTHYIRGFQKGRGSGSVSSTVEARQEPKAQKPGQKQAPKPQRAD